MRSANPIRASSQRHYQTINLNHQKHRILKVPTKNMHRVSLAPINRFVQIKECVKYEPQFKLGKLIGSGACAQVYQAMNMESGEVVACKSILLKFKDQQKLDIEVEFVKKLSHRNIVKYVYHETNKNYLLIYQELMSMGSITQLLHDYGPMQEQVIKSYANQILNGLDYLHQKEILHLDLKSSNILLDSDGIAKISDFGCSKKIQFNMNQSVLQGSIPWMAPEVVRQESLTPAADIWSFGCIVLEMLTGQVPWSEQINFDNPATALLQIAISEVSPSIPLTTSNELKEFLNICLSLDPLQRATINQLKQSAFLQ